MPVCHACQRTFKSKQSLFAHLKHCKQYAETKAQNKANVFPAGRQQHRGPQGTEPNQPSNHARAEDPMDLFKTFMANCGGSSASEPSTSPESCRRLLLQQAKQQTIDSYVSSKGTVSPAMRGEARRAIEIELSNDPLEEFPWTEILERAIAVRDKIYAPYFQQEHEAHEQQVIQERERLEQLILEQRTAEQRELWKTFQLELARLRVTAECERRGIVGRRKWSVELAIEQRLQGVLTGTESEHEAVEHIHLIIDQHFEAYDALGSARGQRKRQELFDQLGDLAIGLTPIAISWATPAIHKGINFVVEKCGLGNPPTPDAASPEGSSSDEPSGPSPHPSESQADTKSSLKVFLSPESDADHDLETPASHES
jgi:hypothetical protein